MSSDMRRFRLHFTSCASSPYAKEVPYAIDILAEDESSANLVGKRMLHQGGLADWTKYVGCEDLSSNMIRGIQN